MARFSVLITTYNVADHFGTTKKINQRTMDFTTLQDAQMFARAILNGEKPTGIDRTAEVMVNIFGGHGKTVPISIDNLSLVIDELQKAQLEIEEELTKPRLKKQAFRAATLEKEELS